MLAKVREAARAGDVQALRLLVNQDNVNACDVDGWTALHHTVEGGQVEAMEFLVTVRNADVNLVNQDGLSALHLSAKRWQVAMVRLLLDHGSLVDAVTTGGFTPVHFAATAGAAGVLEMLFKHNANANICTKECQSPLHSAAFHGRASSVRLLLDRGAIVNAKNRDGETPLSYSISKNHREIAKLLLDAGAPLADVEDAIPDWALELCPSVIAMHNLMKDAVRKNNTVAVRDFLVSKRVSVHGCLATNKSFRCSWLGWAIECDVRDVLVVFLEFGANTNKRAFWNNNSSVRFCHFPCLLLLTFVATGVHSSCILHSFESGC